MKKRIIAAAVAAVLTASFGTSVLAASTALVTGGANLVTVGPRSRVLEALSPYTEYRRDVRVAGRLFSILKLNYAGRLEEVALDDQGRTWEMAEVSRLGRAQYSRYGKVHPHLYRRMQNSRADRFDVLLWVRIDTGPISRIAKPVHVPEGSEAKFDASLRLQYQRALAKVVEERNAVLQRLGLKVWSEPGGEHSPFARVQLSRSEIEALAQSPLVRMITLYEPKGVDDLDDAMAIANADDVHASGVTGNGIKVAVFENAPASTANLDIEDAYSDSIGVAPLTSTHAQHVTAMIKNLNAVSGFAPDALVYSADSKALAAFDWAVDSVRVSALNQSFHRGAEINDGLSSDDLYKDYKVLHYPWPTIVQAAGNWCALGSSCYEMGSDVTDEFVNHKGFNSISIGNHNDDASEMSASSCFVNPSSSHGDRELPELAANGTSVTADGMTKSGTSMSSPAVTGSAALLQDRVATLKYWPEGIRALLFAGSTINVREHAGTLAGGGDAADAPNYWWRDVSLGHDGFDGVGALNIHKSVQIAGRRWNGEAASQGWDIGYMSSGDFDRSGWYERTYRISTGSARALVYRPHVRVALAWNSTATVDDSGATAVYASELGMDLDIRVYDSGGSQVAYSLSWDNSYEVVDFDAEAGETYTVKIHRWSSRPGAWTWFGVAWNVQSRPLLVTRLPAALTLQR
jgi:hypothetical protein